MKVTRIRRVKKILNFYKNNFGIEPPFKVLVDGTFAFRALKAKVNIANELPKYLCPAGARNVESGSDQVNSDSLDSGSRASTSSSNCEILTTNCCLKELESLGPQGNGALCVLRQFPLKPCGHVEPIPPTHCLLSILKKGNPGKFILASMHDELKQMAQNIAQVPILYLNGPTPILEKPPDKAVNFASVNTKKSIQDDEEIHVLKKMKKEMAVNKESMRRVGRKKKAKGPNPLSIKKRKSEKKKPSG